MLSGLGARTRQDAGVACRGTTTIVSAMRASGVERVVVVSAGPRSGRSRRPAGRNLRGGVAASRADVAHLMLRALDGTEMVGHTAGVAS